MGANLAATYPPQGPETFLDPGLLARLTRVAGAEVVAGARARLERMGRRAADEVETLAALADANPPTLHAFDRDGNRIDEVRFHESYERLRRIVYGEEGVIAGAYGRPDASGKETAPRDPKAITFALGMLFGMSESGLYCPVCMTDGAARVIERFAPPEVARRFVPRLAATERPWEGAMWLTERAGGSDVGANETVASPMDAAATGPGSAWRLTGEKWFCSNLGAEVALVLARPVGAAAGTAGLSLFLVPGHLEGGARNPGLLFRRLKPKLGTRSMPTGEVELHGAHAILLASAGQGFKAMAEMLNLSRLYNAVASCAILRRSWVEAREHASFRRAFGRRLEEHPLHQEVVAGLAVTAEAATALTFEAIGRLDRLDDAARRGVAPDPQDRSLHRALTSLVKLHTGKLAVASASEAIECLGGMGYVEEQPTARLLRDAQVLPIWEGTTNILAQDFLFRACGKEGAGEAIAGFVEGRLQSVTAASLVPARDALRGELGRTLARAAGALARGPEEGAREARDVAIAFARVLESAILLAEAEEDLALGDGRAALLAQRHAAMCIPGAPKGPTLDAARYRALVWGERIEGEGGA